MKPSAGPSVLFTVALVLGALGCDTRQVEEVATDEHRFELSEGQSRIDLHLEDGSIEVTSATERVVSISVRSVAHSIERGAARALLEAHPVVVEETEAGIRLRAFSNRGRDFVLGGVTTHVSLRVPDGLELRLRTEDGLIEVEGVQGLVEAGSGDGRIRVRNVRGDMRLGTGDGSIVARDADGELEAWSGDGSIEVDGRFDALRLETSDGRIRAVCREGSSVVDPWLLRSGDGTIDLELASDMNLSIEALTSDGSIDNELPRFRGTNGRFRTKGEVGSGGESVFVSTMEGSIRLR